MPGRIGVLGGDLRRRADGQPVVDLPCAVGYPPRPAAAELDAADAGVVPKEAVAATRDEKGDRNGSVALLEVDHDALLIETAVLLLAETEEPLARVCAELLLDPVVAISIRDEAPRAARQEPERLLGEHLFAVGRARDAQATVLAEIDREVVDHEPCCAAFDGLGPGRRGHREERAEAVVVDWPQGDAHADAVPPPRLDPERLAPALKNDRRRNRCCHRLPVARGLEHVRLLRLACRSVDRYVSSIRINARRYCAALRNASRFVGLDRSTLVVQDRTIDAYRRFVSTAVGSPRRCLPEHGVVRHERQPSDLRGHTQACPRRDRGAHLSAERGRPRARQPANARHRTHGGSRPRSGTRRRTRRGRPALHRDDRGFGTRARPRRSVGHCR